MSSYRNYYDTTFGRTRSDSTAKKFSSDKIPTPRIATKYGGTYTSHLSPTTGSTSGRLESPRTKTVLEKDTSHPPVSYKSPLARSGTRSRDPSPVSKSEKSTSSSSGYYNANRLYPRSYGGGATSRESTVSPASSTSNLPKYTGTGAKYGTSSTKDNITKYISRSPSLSKDDSKYKTASSRSTSKEDASSGSQKYLTSRFLPKNSVERSYTAYARPSTLRSHETSRKNRELLTVLQAQQEQEKLSSRPVSRCSSVTPEDVPKVLKKASPEPEKEMETVTVVTRSTSPTLASQSTSFLRRRTEIAKVIEKRITRQKTVPDKMVDKSIQSDRLDDSTRASRFAGAASRISAAPWSSFLDMKFSSPSSRRSAESTTDQKSLSRTSSTKSVISSKSDKDKDQKKTKSKLTPPKQVSDKKQLPPPIPKNEIVGKSNSLHSLNTPNKDFRKSVLNMNPDGSSKKKLGRRSNSASSADSDVGDPDATDVSENLASCRSFHKSSSASRLPQKVVERSCRSRRSPSTDISVGSTGPSSSEDDLKTKKEKLKSAASSRTSMILTSADELSTDTGPKPKQETGKAEADAKSFLMRALAPVTNLFKHNKHPQAEEGYECDVQQLEEPEAGEKVVWILDPSSESRDATPLSSQKSAKLILHRVESIGDSVNSENDESRLQVMSEPHGMKYSDRNQTSQKLEDVSNRTIRVNTSGEAPWWLDANAPVPEGVQVYPVETKNKPIIKHVESGEKPWWLDESSEVPEGVQTYPDWQPEKDQGEVAEITPKMIIPEEKAKIRPIQSGEVAWWLQDNVEPPEGVVIYPNATNVRRNDSANIMEPEYQERYKIRHIDSGERAWWMNSEENIPAMVQATEESKPKFAIRHQDSGEKAWWLQEHSQKDSDNEFDQGEVPLGDRASPEGLEMPKDVEGRLSPYDNVPMHKSGREAQNIFVSKHKDIDEILGGGGSMWNQMMDKIFGYNEENEECLEVDAREVIIHEGRGDKTTGEHGRSGISRTVSSPFKKLDDAALQLYKDGDYGSYLDLEASISEQQEEFEGFQSNKKNSIVLRTQLSVRVHTIIEKLLTSEGRELRRALFSLKQIFQEDKDLVHEFVQNDGLSCLIKVGSEADQNYQNYILRALGQVMLYVDGMNGVMEHNQTIQWLYSLISSKFRLVVKTALKLLLVFVEYTESNCMLLVKAIRTVDYSQGLLPYHNIMKLLKDFDSADTELLIYATTLINKILSGVPDQDTYYDQVDALEEQGIEAIIQRYMSKPGTDLDLLQQFQIYEAVLQYEDGDDKGGCAPRHLDESIRKTLRSRKSATDPSERRKSRRHSTGTTPTYGGLNQRNNNHIIQTNLEDYDESSSSQSSGVNNAQLNGSYKDSNKANDAGVTPALKRRRERAERQRSFMREQQETTALLKGSVPSNEENENLNGNYTNGLQQRIANGNLLNRTSSRKDLTPFLNAVNKLDSEENMKQPWIMNLEESDVANENDRNLMMQIKKENTVKDITQKLANQSIMQSPSEENKVSRFGDMSGLISKAKEGLAKSKSKADVLKSPTSENIPKIEIKKSENELRWEELVSTLNRPLNLCDMDFTDLVSDDETDVLAPAAVTNGIPPPPPLKDFGSAPPPPPLGLRVPPPVPNAPIFGTNLQRNNKPTESKLPIKKSKKTVKLFWKEVRDDPISHSKLKTGYIWDELNPVSVDTQKLEHLFESRAKDLISKKQQELNKNKEIIVLDPKRSNAINIGMTKLPPPRSIKTAILKMDSTIMNREGIEKLLTMLPTEEERTKIQEAQAANPDLPLGSAEQFLLTLASISELPARLKLWAFKLDFENSEREIAEPLMDLKQGFEVLKVNKTFRAILSTLLSIGNFLNGNEVKGFQIEYLSKVPEVKDTVHKHSLLHHLCHIVMEKFPDATDLYSEIGAITRASKVDFDELALNVQRLEADCKASWDHLKLIAKHDGSTMMKVKMSDFLADCAERIILLGIIHRRIMNRFHKFLLWLGIPFHQVGDTKPNEFCRVVSEFALEYRTTRERVLQQLEKKANHRERNKTRGKMITDVGKFRSKEDRADAELRQLLGSDISDVESLQGTLPWRHRRRDGLGSGRSFGAGSPAGINGNLTDGDDEILESLVKTATKGPRTAPRERKRTRHADRKSLRRTLKNGLSEEEKKHLSTYIKGY